MYSESSSADFANGFIAGQNGANNGCCNNGFGNGMGMWGMESW